MAQGVIIDVQAKVTGYQASLKQLEQALQHIDAGSSIGKQLSAAFEDANKQVKNLGRNLSQRATTDSQIDAIVEKANRAGTAIQRVSELMQRVQVKDINFDSFGNSIKNLQSQIQSLNGTLESNLIEGIQAAIEKSDVLKSTFNDVLKIDPTGKGPSELLDAISVGAQKAASQVQEAEKALSKIETKRDNVQTKLTKDQTGLFGTADSRNQLTDQVRTIENEYESIFSGLRDKITQGLKDKLGADSGLDPQVLIDNFFQGLTPDTLRAKIDELYESLKSADIYQKRSEFYSDLFGGGSNINQVISQINLGDPAPIAEKLRAFLEQIASEIGGKNKAIITDLIDEGQINAATEATLSNISSAYGKVQNRIQKEKDEIQSLNEQVNSASTDLNNARAVQNTITNVDTALRAEITRVLQDNEALRQRIAELEATVKEIQQQNLSNVKSGGSQAWRSAENLKISTTTANEYKSALDQVREREQLIGKVQGVVQRWFSIYAAVSMVSNAIKDVISTIKELDETITEIAIVTNMTQGDLWGQMDSYTEMARSYASSISGVYKVSQLYYQQGLQTADVMALTEQTLKMARISGLDYAEATNYKRNRYVA